MRIPAEVYLGYFWADIFSSAAHYYTPDNKHIYVKSFWLNLRLSAAYRQLLRIPVSDTSVSSWCNSTNQTSIFSVRSLLTFQQVLFDSVSGPGDPDLGWLTIRHVPDRRPSSGRTPARRLEHWGFTRRADGFSRPRRVAAAIPGASAKAAARSVKCFVCPAGFGWRISPWCSTPVLILASFSGKLLRAHWK